MKSRDDTSSRQPHVNEKPKRRTKKRTPESRSRPTELRVDFTCAEPSPEGDAAWRNFIDFLIDSQLRHIRETHGEAAVLGLLRGVEEGKIDPRVALGAFPPYPDDEES